MTKSKKTVWKRDYAGRYINTKTGTVIERSLAGGWNIINPKTGRVLDNVITKRAAQRIYE